MKKWLIIAVAGAAMGLEVGTRLVNRGLPELAVQVAAVTPTVELIPTPRVPESVLMDVPFTAQAPYGEWSDLRQQDGCEEAASLMAVQAMRQTTNHNPQIPKEYAKTEILKIWDYQVERWGGARDTSAADTATRIIRGYFGAGGVEVKDVGGWEEIVGEIMKGNLVITPMNGRKLENPNFTQPGPERHMVLVRGYDAQTSEFITNDPGTRKGELYRYPVEVFFRAIRDYPTGDHVPIVGVEKRMIVVGK